MTAENEEAPAKKSSLCPLSCMGRRRKQTEEDAAPTDHANDVAPTLIEEYPDESFDEPGYARISSMIQDQGATPRDVNEDILDGSGGEHQPQAAGDDEEDESEEDSGQEPVEEAVEAQSFGTLDASVVYAQVNKPTAPTTSGPQAPKAWASENVPTPRSAASPPVASQRSAGSQKRVNFVGDAGPSAPPPLELGAFGDMMTKEEEKVPSGSAKLATEPAGGRLLPGVSLNSYGLASLSVDQSGPQDSLHRSFSSEQSVETQNLKKTIRRLTSELSRQLTAQGVDTGTAEAAGRRLLPGKGPVPPWLCDSRVFSPLLAAYEEQLQGRSQAADRCEAKLSAVEQRIKDVVKENERLRLKLRESQTAGPAAQTEWDVFTEQARLVLEENQLMIQQLELQQEKARQARKEHTTESAKLRCRIEELETENAEAKEEFDRLRAKLHEVKSKYQSAVIDQEDQEMLSVDRVKALNRELQEVREHHKEAHDELLRQLQGTERERVRLTESLADTVAEKDKLRLEVEGLKDLLQSKHRENLQLQKFAKKHTSTQKYLESVIHQATKLESERDSCKAELEAQQKEFANLSQQLLADLSAQSPAHGGKAQALLQEDDQQNGVKKLQRLIGRLLEVLRDNESKKEEAEKEVKYLQSLLKQKSQELQMVQTEKRHVDEEIEETWRKAAADE